MKCVSYSDARTVLFVCGRSRYSLALTGITIVVASLATTIGLLSLAGVGTTLIVWEVRFRDVAPEHSPLHGAGLVPTTSPCETCSQSRFDFVLFEDDFERSSCSDRLQKARPSHRSLFCTEGGGVLNMYAWP